MTRVVRVVAEFVAGGYVEPKGYAEAMLKQAAGYIRTQKRAAGGAYRGQVWSFMENLVAAAKVEEVEG